MLYQKNDSYKFVLPRKNWVDWITPLGKKTAKLHILRSAQKIKKTYFSTHEYLL